VPRRTPLEEVEEVPLRHHGDVRTPDRQPAEIGDGELEIADLAPQVGRLLVRKLQQLFKQPKFMHHLKGGRMQRVSPEVPQEIAVLLQHQDLHP
jgi:hypothetical protein